MHITSVIRFTLSAVLGYYVYQETGVATLAFYSLVFLMMELTNYQIGILIDKDKGE